MKLIKRNAHSALWPMSVLFALPWLVGAKDEGCAFGGQVIVGSGPDGGSCTPQDCQGQPVLTDAKVCPDGTLLGRSECNQQRTGQCGWDFPACPPFDGGRSSPPPQDGGSIPSTCPLERCAGKPVRDDAKVCPDGTSLGRTTCVPTANGDCDWDFPPCRPPVGDGDAGGGSGSGTPACSNAIVTFRLYVDVPASGPQYCVGSNECSGFLINVTSMDGQTIPVPQPACSTTCDTCTPRGCTTQCALPTPVGSDGVTQTWNGTYYTQSTCGSGTVCLAAQCIRPGTPLIATMCASPRSNGDSAPYCEVSASKSCVDVPFVYPPTDIVTGVLRPSP